MHLRKDWDQAQATGSAKKREEVLDNGLGCCLLQESHVAEAVQKELTAGNSVYYHLHAWVFMPNHAHLLLTPLADEKLSRIVQRYKGLSTLAVNRMLNREGRLWRDNYFDRYIRDEEHFWRAAEYVALNPVKAGLVHDSVMWPWGSAGAGWSTKLPTAMGS
jgi:REP element-mobilizing transposase RayT